MQHYTILPFPTQFQGGTTSSTSTPFSIIPTYTGDPTNPTDSPPPPGQGQGGQGGPPQPGIPSSAQLYPIFLYTFFSWIGFSSILALQLTRTWPRSPGTASSPRALSTPSSQPSSSSSTFHRHSRRHRRIIEGAVANPA
ncbi:hypothetical protein B0H13DRAFT_2323927 [Mycena leptocephala]|nr:hypothetical protein B0H13DRAFT_2323927 [Mycena leptocephala]